MEDTGNQPSPCDKVCVLRNHENGTPLQKKKKSLNEQVNLLVQPKKPQDSLSGVWPSSRSNFSKALSGLAANTVSKYRTNRSLSCFPPHLCKRHIGGQLGPVPCRSEVSGATPCQEPQGGLGRVPIHAQPLWLITQNLGHRDSQFSDSPCLSCRSRGYAALSLLPREEEGELGLGQSLLGTSSTVSLLLGVRVCGMGVRAGERSQKPH